MADLARLARNDFVIIGRAGMDFYPDPPGTAIEDATSCVTGLGGSSANIAAAICRLGGKAALVTAVSDDAIGRFCLNALDRFGIDRRYVTTIGGEARNSLAISESVLDGHQTVIYRNGAADFAMTMADVDRVDFAPFGGLITTGTVLAAEPSRAATFHGFAKARDAGLPLVLDVDYRPYSWASAAEAAEVYSRAATLCDVIIGNDVEFGFMAGDYDAGLAKARDLAQTSAQIVVYKMGEKGAITLTGDAEFRTSVYPATPLKPVGAGDAFMGAFMASLAAGRDLRDAVLRGSASAAIVVGRVGCSGAMPTADELDEFCARHPAPL